MVGWCSMGTFNDPWKMWNNVRLPNIKPRLPWRLYLAAGWRSGPIELDQNHLGAHLPCAGSPWDGQDLMNMWRKKTIKTWGIRYFLGNHHHHHHHLRDPLFAAKNATFSHSTLPQNGGRVICETIGVGSNARRVPPQCGAWSACMFWRYFWLLTTEASQVDAARKRHASKQFVTIRDAPALALTDGILYYRSLIWPHILTPNWLFKHKIWEGDRAACAT